MAKLFCPNCAKKGKRVITFALRYFNSKQKWEFPLDKPHFCEICKTTTKEKECLDKDSVTMKLDQLGVN